MSDNVDMDKILDTIAKLFAQSAKAGTAEEAATFAAKAQQLMDKYNLDTLALEKRTGVTSGKREKEMLEGGFYRYQRTLFRKVAELNFCMYSCEEYRATRTKDRFDRKNGVMTLTARAGSSIWKTRHRLIGRTVNVVATKNMVSYLSQAIVRVLREKIRKSDGTIGAGMMHSAWAVSFREGAVAHLVDKIEQARWEAENKRAADRKRAAKLAGAASGTGLTLVDVKESEHAANYDFLHGDGAWARVLEQRAADAAAEKADREMMHELFKSDPKKYREIEAQRRKEARAYRGPRYRSSSRVSDPGGYNAGFDAAEGISLHQQASTTKVAGRLTHEK